MARLKLHCPLGPSDTGAYRLSWDGPGGGTFRLLEGKAVIYQGPAKATTVSGRGEGAYRYTVGLRRSGETEGWSWSDPCVVQVQPPAITTALLLFFVGLGVFLATLRVIIRGHRAHRFRGHASQGVDGHRQGSEEPLP